MAVEVLMPKLGLTMTEGTLSEWKVPAGAPIQKGDILFSVETDKLTSDIPSPSDGILLKTLLCPGQSAPCKSVIAYIGQPDEVLPPAAQTPPPQTAAADAAPAAGTAPPSAGPSRRPGGYVRATPYAKKLARETGRSLDSIQGTGPQGIVLARDVTAAPPRQKATPTAQKLAAELGVDLDALHLSRRATKADILAAADAAAAPVPPAPAQVCAPDGAVRVSPLRRSIAANMSASWAISPRVTYTRPVDASAMQALRAQLSPSLEQQGIRLTYNHIIMKVVARALAEFPDINASFADDMLTRHARINLGLAVAKGDGLVVPNVKDCAGKSLAQIAAEAQTLVERARAGKLLAEDLSDGTFTVTALGPYGITAFSPIIRQPELAILGVCAIVDTPVVQDGQVVVRPMMNLCLTADHRVIDGAMAASFLQRICTLLEHPMMLLI